MFGFVFFVTTISRLVYFTFPIFLLTWILSFTPDGQAEVIDNFQILPARAMQLYIKPMIIGLVLSLIATPFIGYFSDRISFEIQFIVAFGMRLSAALSFFLLQKPESNFSMFIVVILIISNYAEHIVTNSFFSKRMAGDVRGSYRGVVQAVALFFAFIFQIASYKLVKNGYSASTPIMIIATFDGLVIYVCFIIGVLQLNPELNLTLQNQKVEAEVKANRNKVMPT